MEIKKFDVELISDVITSLKNVSKSEIGKIALYFWYFSVDNKEDALGQYIARLARYAFFMGMEMKSDFETLYPNKTEENFETFFKKWESEITFSPFEELFADEMIDGNA